MVRMRRLLVVIVTLAPAMAFAQTADTVRLRVADADGVPLARVRVAAAATPGAQEPFEPLFTDDRGEVAVTASRSMRSLRLSKAGFTEHVLLLRGDAVPDVVQLARAASITGRVTTESGAPVPGVTIAAGAASAVTNGVGEYRLGRLAAGRYDVALPRLANVEAMRVTVRAGDAASGIDFVVAPPACPPAASQARGGTAIVRGRITSMDGLPVGCAYVRLLAQGAPLRTAVTDAAGRFVFRDLPAATYRLDARQTGYAATVFGGGRSIFDGRRIAVADGEEVAGIDLAMPRATVITGTVADERGEPIEDASVTLLQLRSIDGRTVAATAATAVSDDRGAYRLAGVSPGRYLLAAAPHGAISGRSAVRYTATYHPGTSDINAATVVHVEPAAGELHMDLVAMPTRVAEVRGRVLTPDGRPYVGWVLLSPSQRAGGIAIEPLRATARPDGWFTLASVLPGDYVVQAMQGNEARGAASAFGMAYVTVSDRDPAPVRIRLAPTASVEGRLIVEGDGRKAGDFNVAAFPSDFDQSFVIGNGFPGSRGPDGRFVLDTLTGPRRIVLMAAPDGWYLKSVTLGGRDITDDAFDFGLKGGAFRELDVLVSPRGAVVTGRLLEPPPDAYAVVVYPTAREQWFRHSRYVKIGRSDQAGGFRIDGLPPGEYWVAATGAADEDPETFEALIPHARRVTLQEGERLGLDLSLVGR